MTPTVRRSSAVIIGVDVFYRVNYLVNELHSDARDDPLCFGEGTLQTAQGHSCFLGGHPREQLEEAPDQRSSSETRVKRRTIPRPMLGGRRSPIV